MRKSWEEGLVSRSGHRWSYPSSGVAAGIRSTLGGGDAAYLASRNLMAEACKKLSPEFVKDGLATADVQLGLGGAVTRINRKLPPDKQMGLNMEDVKAAPRPGKRNKR